MHLPIQRCVLCEQTGILNQVLAEHYPDVSDIHDINDIHEAAIRMEIGAGESRSFGEIADEVAASQVI